MPLTQPVQDCLGHLQEVTADPDIPLDHVQLKALLEELTSM